MTPPGSPTSPVQPHLAIGTSHVQVGSLSFLTPSSSSFPSYSTFQVHPATPSRRSVSPSSSVDSSPGLIRGAGPMEVRPSLPQSSSLFIGLLCRVFFTGSPKIWNWYYPPFSNTFFGGTSKKKHPVDHFLPQWRNYGEQPSPSNKLNVEKQVKHIFMSVFC